MIAEAPKLATRRELLALSDIVVDPSIQQRAEIDEPHVCDLVAAIEHGDKLPPLRVYDDGNRRLLARGFHRHEAYRRAGWTTVECDVVDGDRRAAMLDACGDNADHGLKRSNADKRRAVETLLADPEWGSRSDRWIADTARAPLPFVGSPSAPFRPSRRRTHVSAHKQRWQRCAWVVTRPVISRPGAKR